jgi:hypothetical protein
MSHRQHRKAELQHKREERNNKPDSRAHIKAEYYAKSHTELEGEDLVRYTKLIGAIEAQKQTFLRRGVSVPDFPAEHPTTDNLDSARRFCYVHCPESLEKSCKEKPDSLNAITEAFSQFRTFGYPRYTTLYGKRH